MGIGELSGAPVSGIRRAKRSSTKKNILVDPANYAAVHGIRTLVRHSEKAATDNNASTGSRQLSRPAPEYSDRV